MKKNLTKNEKGITLVALIITIIILLILAVISIRAIKDGGILSKTQTAKEVYSGAEEEEKVKLAVQEAAIDGAGTVEKEHLEIAVKNQFKPRNTQVNESKNDFLVTIENSENEYLVSKEGNVTKKAPSNIKYIYGVEETPGFYMVLLKDNTAVLISGGEIISTSKYSIKSVKTDITELEESKDYTSFSEEVKKYKLFMINEQGELGGAFGDNMSTYVTFKSIGGDLEVALEMKLMNNVDLSEYGLE